MKRKATAKGKDSGESGVKKPAICPRDAGDSSSDSDLDDSDAGGIPLTSKNGKDDDDGSSDDDDDDDDGPLNVTFEFRDPTADSFGAIRNFLGKWPVKPCNVSELADEIADQAQIGTVVIQEQMGDIFAFVSALNLGPHRDKPCLEQVRAFLLEKCPANKATKAKLHELLRGSKAAGTGILIREGMVNLPPEIYPSLHEMLINDIGWASENAEGEAEEQDSCFKNLIFIAAYSEVGGGSSGSSSSASSSSANSGDGSGGGGSTGIIFDRFDDDILAQAATWDFRFEAEVNGTMRKFLAGVVPFDGYVKAAREMKALLSGSQK